MQDTCFTVEEAASIMGCDRATVYRLLTEGWLRRPEGKTKKETGGRVTKKSLYQVMVVDRLSRLPIKVLREIRRDCKYFEKSESQMANANRYIDEGEDNAPNALPSSAPSHEYPNPQKPCLHHDFAEQHQDIFRKRARQLASDDRAFQDDLVQEMSLAVLEYDKPADFEFLLEIAFNRAIDYIRYEAARGMLSLKQARHASNAFAEKMASLMQFIDELRQRGVPAEWIEEVIGQQLNVA